jgi:hypothetical protein
MHATALAPIPATIKRAGGSRRRTVARRQFRMRRREIRVSRRLVQKRLQQRGRISHDHGRHIDCDWQAMTRGRE